MFLFVYNVTVSDNESQGLSDSLLGSFLPELKTLFSFRMALVFQS